MNLKDITLQVVALTKSVGEFISQEGQSFTSDQIQTKSKNSLVSYVDQTAEKKLVEGLKSILPEAGFITEEETVKNETKEINWIVDPLDGTTNFMHQIPVFSISIALMKDEEIIAGVVYEVNRQEAFYAFKDGGCFLNDHPIKVTNTAAFKDTLIATGFPYYDYTYLPKYLNTLSHLMNETRGIRRLGSAAVDLAYVAAGRFDSFYEYSLHPWDVAAGAILVKEAGGVVNDFKGGNDFLFGKEILASNPHIQPLMLNLLKEHFNND